MLKEKREIVSILVDNRANVLTRVTNLFGRRGYNIDSLTVSATNNPDISRITIVFSCTDQSLPQIIAQTEKLENVRSIFILEHNNSLYRELLLVKVRASHAERAELKEFIEIYRGKIVDLSPSSIIIELTGSPEKLDGFLDMLTDYQIMDICRTGITGIARKE